MRVTRLRSVVAVGCIQASLLSLAFASSAAAGSGGPVLGGGNATGSGTQKSSIGPLALFGPQVPLHPGFTKIVKGDYVAAGIGMRNIGGGTILNPLPPGSAIDTAALIWQIIRAPGALPEPPVGIFNGVPIKGRFIGTTGSPCWGAGLSDVYGAEVTATAIDGANVLTGFPSGIVTPGNVAPAAVDPQAAPGAYPLLEGASLVTVFTNPAYDVNRVSLRQGAQTFFGQSVSTSFPKVTSVAGANPADEIAKTTYIVGDGQLRFPSDRAGFNGVFLAGPGTGLKAADAFDGADGIAAVAALDGLWDTLTIDVSGFFPPGIPKPSSKATVDASPVGTDCLTWAVQMLSVKVA